MLLPPLKSGLVGSVLARPVLATFVAYLNDERDDRRLCHSREQPGHLCQVHDQVGVVRECYQHGPGGARRDSDENQRCLSHFEELLEDEKTEHRAENH